MIKVFTGLYLKQFFRLLREIGFWRTGFIIAAAMLAFFALLKKVEENAVVPSIIILAIILSLHFQRNDKLFLKGIHVKDKRLYFTHYHLLLIPFYTLLLIFGKIGVLLILFSAISIVPLIPPVGLSSKEYHIALPEIPVYNFEFRSGIRKYSFLLLLMYLLAFVFYQVPYVALGAIVVFTFISTTFYHEAEPWQMVEVYQLSPAKFLWMKIKNQWMDFWRFSSPFALLFLIAKPEFWYILLVWVLVCSIIQACSICLKYTFYEPHKGFDNSIFMAIYFVSLFVPFFVPVPLVMLANYSKSAITNLNQYLDDYH